MGKAHSTVIHEDAEWITLHQAATYLTVSWDTIRRMISDGRIKKADWKRVGRQLRVRKAAVA